MKSLDGKQIRMGWWGELAREVIVNSQLVIGYEWGQSNNGSTSRGESGAGV